MSFWEIDVLNSDDSMALGYLTILAGIRFFTRQYLNEKFCLPMEGGDGAHPFLKENLVSRMDGGDGAHPMPNPSSQPTPNPTGQPMPLNPSAPSFIPGGQPIPFNPSAQPVHSDLAGQPLPFNYSNGLWVRTL